MDLPSDLRGRRDPPTQNTFVFASLGVLDIMVCVGEQGGVSYANFWPGR